MRFGAAMLIGAATLLSACAEQSEGYAPSNGAASYYSYYGHATPAWYSDEPGYYGPEYAAPAYPGYADEPGYYGPGNYGPGVIIGGDGWLLGERLRSGSLLVSSAPRLGSRSGMAGKRVTSAPERSAVPS